MGNLCAFVNPLLFAAACSISCSDGKLHEYRGDRSAKHLKDWALSLLPKHVKTVSKQSHLTDLLRQCTSGGGSSSKWGACALLLSDKRETSSLYKSLALRCENSRTESSITWLGSPT